MLTSFSHSRDVVMDMEAMSNPRCLPHCPRNTCESTRASLRSSVAQFSMADTPVATLPPEAVYGQYPPAFMAHPCNAQGTDTARLKPILVGWKWGTYRKNTFLIDFACQFIMTWNLFRKKCKNLFFDKRQIKKNNIATFFDKANFSFELFVILIFASSQVQCCLPFVVCLPSFFSYCPSNSPKQFKVKNVMQYDLWKGIWLWEV